MPCCKQNIKEQLRNKIWWRETEREIVFYTKLSLFSISVMHYQSIMVVQQREKKITKGYGRIKNKHHCEYYFVNVGSNLIIQNRIEQGIWSPVDLKHPMIPSKIEANNYVMHGHRIRNKNFKIITRSFNPKRTHPLRRYAFAIEGSNLIALFASATASAHQTFTEDHEKYWNKLLKHTRNKQANENLRPQKNRKLF